MLQFEDERLQDRKDLIHEKIEQAFGQFVNAEGGMAG